MAAPWYRWNPNGPGFVATREGYEDWQRTGRTWMDYPIPEEDVNSIRGNTDVCGLDLLGAVTLREAYEDHVLGAAAAVSPHRIVRQSVDTWLNPSQVLVNPHAAASATFTNVAKVVVTGGQRWVPGWKKGVTAYQKPSAAVLYLNNGSKKYTSPDAVEVTAPPSSMSTTVMGASGTVKRFRIGDAGTGGAPSVQPGASDFAAAAAAGAFAAPQDLPSDGRPAKGWSQPQPVKPAVTPETSVPTWKKVLIGVAGGLAVIATASGIALAAKGRRR